MANPQQLNPPCPRCGYDQSGEVARWVESCPMRGTCTECGLEFDWADVFHPERHRVRGFVEHGRGWRGVILDPWITWTWTLLPWVFWKRVKLEHRFSPLRMGLWMPLLALHVKVAASIASLLGYAVYWLSAPPSSLGQEPWLGIVNVLLEPLADFDRSITGYRIGLGRLRSAPLYALPLLLASLAYPLVLLCLPWTRRAAKVRARHVVRAWVYSFAPAGIVGLIFLFTRISYAIALATASGGRTMERVSAWLVGATSRIVWSLSLGQWWVMVLIGLAWLALWWQLALTAGFRIKSARVVHLTLLFIAILAAATALTLDKRLLYWLAGL